MKKFLALLIVVAIAVSAFAACKPVTPPVDNEVVYDVAGAAAYVDALYREDLSITAVDYTVVSQVIVGGVTYTVDWAVDTDKVVVGTPANGVVAIEVDEKSPEEVTYKLTATVKAADGTSETVTFKLNVPKYNVNSHADYMAAQKGDTLTVEGIVVAINSKAAGNKYNHLFLADASVTGGYYCYSVTQDPAELGIQVGMTVAVTGPMEPYSGMQEIKGGQVAIVDSTIKTVDVVDITAEFTAGANLGAFVGLPVVVKGVTIGTQDLEKDTSQYLYFAIGEQQGYLRTYVTDFPTTISADDKAGIDADHAAHFGYTADVTGILILYNGAPYLIPMTTTPFTNYTFVEKTAEEKVAAELDNLTIDASASSDTIIDLLATGKYYDDVTFTWATTDETGAATIADGKLTLVVPDAETIVKVTVTATCGDATDTKEFSVKLSKVITPIKDAMEIGAAQDSNYTAEKYIIAGIIDEVYNTTYGNMYIVDELGNKFTVYGTYSADGSARYDAMESQPVAGDYVVILGSLGQYNGTPQMKNGWIQSFTAPITVAEAIELGNTFEKNQYTEDKKVVTGVITEVQNTTYGNVVIADEEGNSILVYGLYNANGTARYDAMETQPIVGDTITVLGIVGKYSAPQMKNGWLVAYTAGSEEGAEEETTTEATAEETTEATGPVEVTIPEAIALEDGAEVIVTGTVKEINTAWNEQYGNITVTIEDAEGNTLYIYRLKANVEVGAVIKITGKVGSYNGSKQIAAGATAEVLEAAPISVTLAEAVELEDGVKVIVKGTVKEINTAWSEQYGNISVTIEDAEGNTLYIYRLKANVEVGDVVTITGKIGSYNGSKQIAAGATAVIESAE